ncbi:MAG TPA: HAD family phosphatase, partial [Anaeromyxobacteraceae bacterium]|nr:HAD family phosphatase [Anaeromyxobacteraceae bacterium]
MSAVIFDVDGTLLDSEENYYLADRRLLERYGIEFTREEKRRYVGTGNRDMMADIKRRYGISESAEELVTQKNSIYLEIAAQDTRVYPEVARLVYLLRSEGIPIAAASGSSPQVLRLLLASVGLAGEL